MSHVWLTAITPVDESRVDAVLRHLAGIGSPPCGTAPNPQYATLDATGAVHFASLIVVRSDAGKPAHLVFEVSGDGPSRDLVLKIQEHCGGWLPGVYAAAGTPVSAPDIAPFLERHHKPVGGGPFNTAGVNFSGTPGLDLPRIRAEEELQAAVEAALVGLTGTPLDLLRQVRAKIKALRRFDWAFDYTPTPLDEILPVPSLPRLIGAGVWTFLWPAVLFFAALLPAVLMVSWAFVANHLLAVLIGIAAWFVALLFVFVASAALLYRALSKREAADVPDDSDPNLDTLAAIMARENHAAQNHLAGVSRMKPGWLRLLALKIVFWLISYGGGGKPGFLSDIGTIHFARWILVPGTDRLVFLSNYGGSWESYLEDFVTKANAGLTGVWSNTAGFPRTRLLTRGGASDGDRFKRWARRQQIVTPFWYSAYPRLTTERIRRNAAIRRNLAVAITEKEASIWLSLFGSQPAPRTALETNDVPTLVFGGLSFLKASALVAVHLPDDRREAAAWLRRIKPDLCFGDARATNRVTVLALAAGGFRKLGLSRAEMATFTPAFLEGMATPTRSRLLGDVGPSAPSEWEWGAEQDVLPTIDAVLLLYTKTTEAIVAMVEGARSAASTHGGAVVRAIPLRTLASDAPREPFGFVDGVSQPILLGTHRWRPDATPLHFVETGEFVLGYPDGRDTFPPTPRVASTSDPTNILREVELRAELGGTRWHDLGRNGTYLVVRQLEQDVKAFDKFLEKAARDLGAATPAEIADRKEWVAAKMVGRWRDGASLVRYPNGKEETDTDYPPTADDARRAEEAERDQRRLRNDFLFGRDDPQGHKCPFGAHIRRANPRDSFHADSRDQIAISNRHRVLRVGRQYEPDTGRDPGLMFMCLNGDIERQFEFVQQTWLLSPTFHGLRAEEDPLLGTGDRLTIPRIDGFQQVCGLSRFITVLGGGYFFMPGRTAVTYLGQRA